MFALTAVILFRRVYARFSSSVKIRANRGNLNFCKKRSVKEAIHTYMLAIYSCVLKKEKHVIMAGLYLRLSWIYRIDRKSAFWN
ncbi:DUF2225 domain-containing protein [Metabacillus dongyingensis]|uniref:DUF2225 domain-containing protein n=1 Tax=Metabacillus dongyingensis TaxID=2874282 RepID=UPI003B8E62D4